MNLLVYRRTNQSKTNFLEPIIVAQQELSFKTFWQLWRSNWMFLFLGSAPLFLVTVRSWSNAILILGALLCLIDLLRHPIRSELPLSITPFTVAAQRAFLATFFAPVLVIGVSSILRGHHNAADYDSASRFLLAILVFTWIQRHRLSAIHVLQFTIPIGLILTLLHQFIFPQPHLWGTNRMSTYFADPLVFGYTALTLGLMSLISIHLLSRDGKLLVILKIIGVCSGCFLSIQSGSRTGWFAVPIVLGVWMYYRSAASVSIKMSWKWAIATTIMLVLFFALSETVQQRLAQAIQDVADYPWSGIAPETSVGFRITFLRIATDLFISNPWNGFGDTSQYMEALPAMVYGYASPEAIRMAMQSGFHNEVVTQTIRSGAGGLLSALALFFIPLWIFSRQMRGNNLVQRGNALTGMALVIGFLVSSLSTEVFDLKYTASFYALMVALLCGSALSAESTEVTTS